MERYRYETEEPTVGRQDIYFFRQECKGHSHCFTAHIHSAIEVLFVRSGTLKVTSEDEVLLATAGSTVLIRANTGHTGEAIEETGCTYWVLKVKPSYLYDLSFRNRSHRYLLDFTLNRAGKKILWTAEESRTCGITTAVEALIREQERGDYGYDIAMKVQASSILLALLRGMQTDATEEETEATVRAVYETVCYINEHYGEDLTAEDCAKRSYLSYSYFSRTFRKVTGKPFRTYLNDIRIDHAERALTSEKHPITQIASECGFNNVAYFISVFRRRKGMTPSAFRKANN